MHIKPLKHMQFTLITMKGSVFTSLFIILLLAYRSKGYPRSQMIRLTCSQQLMNNSTEFFQNFNSMMEIIDNHMLISNNVTTHTGIGPDSNYGLAECHGDLSADDCYLCYSEARTSLSSCFPNNGAQVFLDGCFIRTQNYSFYEEYAGRNDSVICGNTTRSSVVFRDSVRQAISDAVRDAPRNNDLFARETANESVYVLADCWNTLNETSCTECLDGAFATILQCLPFSEGRALHTGCFIRYSDTNFLNPEPTGGYNGEKNATSQVIQKTCGNTAGNSSSFTFNFFQVMLVIGSKMKTSHFGTGVAGSEADKTYGLGQCYTDISTNDCNLCYVEARTALTGCIPNSGGRIYLKHCFLRYENYSFFEEYTGQQDRSICPNNTFRRNNALEKSVRKVVSQAVVTATRSNNKLARIQALIPGTENNSVYAVSNCWFTLDVDSCGNCLQKASKSILDCLPASEGYALFTGCFMGYNESSSVYPHHKTLSKGKIVAIVMAVSSIVAFLVVSIISLYAWKQRRKSKRKGSDDTKLLEILNSSSLNFKYSTIEKATSSFDEVNKLGQGGFGIVYKGVLPDGKEIAVKRLFVNHRHRARDFYNEVNMISSVDHKNLVKLVGFSCLGPESILIYEYLPNRSLDYFIFDAVRGKEVNWGKRYDIIVGIAEGLAYLHENSKTRIIHRDIKAANILLDSRLRAKIADFGLARSFQEDKNHISTGIAGTLGYMAPEYISQGKLTEKVDVYSFGVLLLEIVTGMSNRRIQTSEYTDSLVSIAWKHFKEGSADELFDPNLMLNDLTSSNMKKEIQSVVHIGLLCIQEVASLRPTMSMALQMLSKNIEPLPSPSNPPYIPESTVQLNEFGPIHNLASVPTVSHSSGIPR